MIKTSGITLLVLLFVLAGSCKKKETAAVDNETQSVVDNAIADQEFMALAPALHQNALNTKGTGAHLLYAPCDTFTFIGGDTSDFIPNPLYTMSVSNAACNLTMPDGRTRAGTLLIRLTGKLKNVGSQMIIKMKDYKVTNTADPSRTLVYTCDSMVVTTLASASGIISLNVKLVGGYSSNVNYKIKFEFDRTVNHYFLGSPTMTEGPYITVYGKATGINRNGRKFEVNVPQATPLVKHRNCQFIDKGILELTPEGFKTRTVDYGSGLCDDDATFLVNGNTIAFKLK